MDAPKSSAPARPTEDPAPRLPDHELIRLDAAAHPWRTHGQHVEAAREIAGRTYVEDLRRTRVPRAWATSCSSTRNASVRDRAGVLRGSGPSLCPGDSLLAPRMVPHGWAHIGEDPGTLLLAVQPAGSLEAFFLEGCEMSSLPTPEGADRMFADHGMKVVGPPLDVD